MGPCYNWRRTVLIHLALLNVFLWNVVDIPKSKCILKKVPYATKVSSLAGHRLYIVESVWFLDTGSHDHLQYLGTDATQVPSLECFLKLLLVSDFFCPRLSRLLLWNEGSPWLVCLKGLIHQFTGASKSKETHPVMGEAVYLRVELLLCIKSGVQYSYDLEACQEITNQQHVNTEY